MVPLVISFVGGYEGLTGWRRSLGFSLAFAMGLAVTFTATTVVGGIFFWTFSNLRFQAEMAQLLTVLMAINMLGAITVVPAFYSIVRPRVVTSMLRSES